MTNPTYRAGLFLAGALLLTVAASTAGAGSDVPPSGTTGTDPVPVSAVWETADGRTSIGVAADGQALWKTTLDAPVRHVGVGTAGSAETVVAVGGDLDGDGSPEVRLLDAATGASLCAAQLDGLSSLGGHKTRYHFSDPFAFDDVASATGDELLVAGPDGSGTAHVLALDPSCGTVTEVEGTSDRRPNSGVWKDDDADGTTEWIVGYDQKEYCGAGPVEVLDPAEGTARHAADAFEPCGGKGFDAGPVTGGAGAEYYLVAGDPRRGWKHDGSVLMDGRDVPSDDCGGAVGNGMVVDATETDDPFLLTTTADFSPCAPNHVLKHDPTTGAIQAQFAPSDHLDGADQGGSLTATVVGDIAPATGTEIVVRHSQVSSCAGDDAEWLLAEDLSVLARTCAEDPLVEGDAVDPARPDAGDRIYTAVQGYQSCPSDQVCAARLTDGLDATGSVPVFAGTDARERIETSLVPLDVAPLPDLVLEDIEAHPDPAVAGEEITVEVRVANQGDGAAQDAGLQVRRGRGVLGEAPIGFLGPGNATTVTVNTTWTPDPGRHRVSAWVDPADEIDETEERNNRDLGGLTVLAPADPLTAIGADRREPVEVASVDGPRNPYEERDVPVEVRNTGAGPMPSPTTATVTACPEDPALAVAPSTASCRIVDRRSSPLLGPGGTWTYHVEWNPMGKAGDWTLCSSLDYPRPQESNRNDEDCRETHAVVGGTGLGGQTTPLLAR